MLGKNPKRYPTKQQAWGPINDELKGFHLVTLKRLVFEFGFEFDDLINCTPKQTETWLSDCIRLLAERPSGCSDSNPATEAAADESPVFIYHITHTADGRVYVGQSSRPTDRWRQHHRKPPTLLQQDAQRYQTLSDGFRFEVVQEVSGRAAAHAAEAADIQRLRQAGVSGSIAGACLSPATAAAAVGRVTPSGGV
ncbi:hypothetical protein HXX76_016222 [Chlamydomonas incerta]|uniref:GIY-YIG domain-containing protein n=1 Tax=Chlamydomonas incerta TaxID=51695 RepID=A0A835S7I2_CHLIN|nr:hypothetical protein HXX76_016222 [Chlamydomonas incerta]|eukprot:KAG2422183.1 hypothetical protein HXX76_016222 [Chlamydomonas incerta]